MSTKKRVLFYYMRGIIDGGSDHSLFFHLIKLDKTKFEPIVLFRDEGEFIEKLRLKNIKVIKHKYFARIHPKTHPKLYNSRIFNLIPGGKTGLYFLRSIIEILIIINLIIKYKIDIVHLNHSINGDKTAAISGIISKKKIFAHSRAAVKMSKLDLFLIKYIDKIICISEYVKKQHILLGVNPDKCITIYNGVDVSNFQNINRKYDNNKITLGYVGRLENWKGVHILLNSLKIVIQQDKKVKVLLVGDGNKRQELENLTRDYNLEKNVTFLGKVTNIADIYSAIDVLIHTSIEPEPFGRVIIEAMVSGLPVIATDIGGPKEIISNDYDGYLLEPGDPQILAEKIIELINNNHLREKLGSNAKLKIETNFNILTTTKEIEQLYLANNINIT